MDKINTNYSPDERPRRRKFLSVDPGTTNFGYVTGETDLDFENLKITGGEVVDITNMHTTLREEQNCDLDHRKCPANWMLHFIRRHKDYIDECEYILVESQPPFENASTVSVEQILLAMYHTKIKTCIPCSMHKRFQVAGRHIGDLTERREWRKRNVIEKAMKYLDTEQRESFDKYRHKDWSSDQMQHVSDATCQMVYMVEKLASAYKRSRKDPTL